MQDRPDKLALLGAIARVLERDVRPALKDPGLSFRALVAAHLATTLAAEIEAEDDIEAAELSRLRALLPDSAGPDEVPETRASRRRERLRLRRELARRIRARALDDQQRARAFAHVMQTLREDLRVYNRKFDTSAEHD
ncbi:MAG: hypothetical protein IT372_00475 [Polyangiaceae bacterium]|nr:hypothetical protein [Polyangiaceae bacterium]